LVALRWCFASFLTPLFVLFSPISICICTPCYTPCLGLQSTVIAIPSGDIRSPLWVHRYAVNGGPFDMATGACIGVLITNGKTLVDDYTIQSPLFGITADNQWIIGLPSAADTRRLNVTEAVSGFGWLVQNGSNVVATKGGEVAPRTAVGTDVEGRLLLLTVDGCEKCKSGDQGQTLYQLAEQLIAVGAR